MICIKVRRMKTVKAFVCMHVSCRGEQSPPVNSVSWWLRPPVSVPPFSTELLQAVTDELCSWLSEGWTVEVGELGYFSVSLKCDRQVTDKKEIRSPSVHFQNVNLRLGSKFRNRFSTMELERKASPYVSRSLMGEEERKEKLLQHLNKHGCITRADYESITGLVRHRAVSDLNRYLAEGMIRKYGSGKTVVYLKP